MQNDGETNLMKIPFIQLSFLLFCMMMKIRLVMSFL